MMPALALDLTTSLRSDFYEFYSSLLTIKVSSSLLLTKMIVAGAENIVIR